MAKGWIGKKKLQVLVATIENTSGWQTMTVGELVEQLHVKSVYSHRAVSNALSMLNAAHRSVDQLVFCPFCGSSTSFRVWFKHESAADVDADGSVIQTFPDTGDDGVCVVESICLTCDRMLPASTLSNLKDAIEKKGEVKP